MEIDRQIPVSSCEGGISFSKKKKKKKKDPYINPVQERVIESGILLPP